MIHRKLKKPAILLHDSNTPDCVDNAGILKNKIQKKNYIFWFCFHAISLSPKLSRVFLEPYRNTENVLYFLNRNIAEELYTMVNLSIRSKIHFLQ
jgi:hypothetical protein